MAFHDHEVSVQFMIGLEHVIKISNKGHHTIPTFLV